MRNRFLCTALLAFGVLSLAAPARAQDWIFGQPILAPQQYWTLMDDKDFSEDSPDYADTEARAALLTYTPLPERTATNLANFVEHIRSTDPAAADQLQAQFASMNIIATLGDAMQDVGLDKNDIADAYTVWLLNAWSAAHGDLSETPPETAAAVSLQMKFAMLQAPDLLALDDALKQELAESLLIQGVLIAASASDAAGNPAASAEVAKAVRQGALTASIDLDAIRLTDTGFVPVTP